MRRQRDSTARQPRSRPSRGAQPAGCPRGAPCVQGRRGDRLFPCGWGRATLVAAGGSGSCPRSTMDDHPCCPMDDPACVSLEGAAPGSGSAAGFPPLPPPPGTFPHLSPQSSLWGLPQPFIPSSASSLRAAFLHLSMHSPPSLLFLSQHRQPPGLRAVAHPEHLPSLHSPRESCPRGGLAVTTRGSRCRDRGALPGGGSGSRGSQRGARGAGMGCEEPARPCSLGAAGSLPSLSPAVTRRARE